MQCPMCHGTGQISVRRAIVGPSVEGGPKHLVNTGTDAKPCPMGCRTPAEPRGVSGSPLVGREAPWPKSRVRVKAPSRRHDDQEPFSDYQRDEAGEGLQDATAMARRIRDFYGF
jgi:hypothetical protein